MLNNAIILIIKFVFLFFIDIFTKNNVKNIITIGKLNNYENTL